jgi:hypothetical protein
MKMPKYPDSEIANQAQFKIFKEMMLQVNLDRLCRNTNVSKPYLQEIAKGKKPLYMSLLKKLQPELQKMSEKDLSNLLTMGGKKLPEKFEIKSNKRWVSDTVGANVRMLHIIEEDEHSFTLSNGKVCSRMANYSNVHKTSLRAWEWNLRHIRNAIFKVENELRLLQQKEAKCLNAISTIKIEVENIVS